MAAASEPRKLILHVVHVGAGLANIIEVEEDETSGVKFYVYDGGSSDFNSLQTSDNLQNALQQCLCGQTKQQSSSLNGIIVSHPDVDHFNLTAKLFEQGKESKQTGNIKFPCDIEFTGQIVLTEAFNWKKTKECASFLQSLKRLNFKPVPIASKEVKGNDNLIKMATCFTLYFPLFNDGCSGTVWGKNVSHEDELNPAMEGCAKSGFDYNKSSTILKVGKQAIFTGDAHAQTLKDDSLIPKGRSMLKVFNVPHHGSREQYIGPCDKKWKCLLVYRALLMYQQSGRTEDLVGYLSRNRRTDAVTMYEEAYFSSLRFNLDNIVNQESDSICKDLNELKKERTWSVSIPPEHLVKSYRKMKRKLTEAFKQYTPKAKSEVDSLFNCLECGGVLGLVEQIADFYEDIPAETYVISCGSRYKHPHEEVLSGIILSVLRKQEDSNKKRKNSPVTLLVVSGSASLKDKIYHLPPNIDAARFSELVTIKCLSRNVSSVPIDLLSDENALLSNNDLETWSWLRKDDLVDTSYTREISQGEKDALQYSGNSGRVRDKDEDPPLSEYLKVVDPSLNPEEMNLSSVLQLLVGPQVERKLSENNSALIKHSTNALLNKALKMKVKEESEFVLSGETHHITAKSAKLVLQLPDSFLSFMDVDVQAINVEIENAKTIEMSLCVDVELAPEGKVSRKMSLDFSKLCFDVSSIGRPLSNLLSEIGSESKADEYTVGALLGLILGGAGARHLICSFPIKLSASLASWKLNLNSTVIDFDAGEESLIFRGAFIVGTPPTQQQSIEFNPTLLLEPTTLEIKLPPLQLHSTDGVYISGLCIVNKTDHANYRALSKSYQSSEIEIEFCNIRSPADLLEFFGVDAGSSSDYYIQILHKRLDQCSVVSTGFTVEQPAEYYTDTKVSSFFFQLDPASIDIHSILPHYLQKRLTLKAVRAISLYPPNSSLLGLESVLECDISTPMELKLRILPLKEKGTVQHTTTGLTYHSYLIWLRPLPMLQNEVGSVQIIASPSLLDLVGTFCPDCNFKEVLLSFPKINLILESIQLRYFHTNLNPSLQSLSIQQFELNLYVPCLEIIPHKLTIESADVEFFYSKEYVSVSSNCKITVLEEYVCMVSFSLPSQDREGHFSIRNYSNELTLKRALEGFGIPESYTELPLISTLLEISMKSIDLSLDHDYSVTKAELTIYKEEIILGKITLSEVELTIIYTNDTATKSSLTFAVQGFIGESLFTTLSYESDNSVLSGSVDVRRKAGKGVKLSSFLEFVGLPKPDIPGNVEDLFNFMNLEVQSASVSLKMCPSITIEALELKLKSVGSLELSTDPKIILHEVQLHVLYKETDGVKLSVKGHINLSSIRITLIGTVDSKGVSLKGRVEKTFDFASAIDELRASHSEPLIIPDLSDLRQKLTSMNSLEFSIMIENDKSSFMIQCFSSVELSLSLGTFTLNLQALGAKVSLIAQEKSPVQYSGYICGRFSVHNLQAEVRLILVSEGERKDIIFIGCCQGVDAMHLESLTKTIESAPLSTSQAQTQVSNISLSSSLPPKFLDLEVKNAVLAANFTQKQLVFYLDIKKIGSALLMFSQIHYNNEFLLGISLPHGYMLQQISDILAPIDNILKVRDLHLLFNTMESANLDVVLNSFHKAVAESDDPKSTMDTFNEARDCLHEIEVFRQAPPFASFTSTDTVFVKEKELKMGFYLYCKLDMPALKKESETLFSDIIQLSDSGFPDIVLSMYIGQGGFKEEKRDLSLSAYIPSITLLGELKFSSVYLEYNMSRHSEVSLSGELSVSLAKDRSISIVGCMHISKKFVKFSAKYPPKKIDSISSPLGVAGITLRNIKCEVELIRKENQRMDYTIALKGEVKFNNPSLSFESSVVFKGGRAVLLAMSLKGSLRLSDFLKAAFDFEGISQDSFLDIGFHNGHLVYAREQIPFEGYKTKTGFNAMCKVTVIKREFEITAWFTRGSTLQFGIEGSMVDGVIDILGLIQLKSPDFRNNSVVLGCNYSSKSDQGLKLFLSAGVSLLDYNVCKTVLSYSPSVGVFEGEFTCKYEFLSEMSIGFTWSKEDKFKIVKWPAVGELPIQKVLDILETVYDVVSLIMAAATGGLSALFTCVAKYVLKKCLKFGFKINARLEDNPDPSKYRVIIGLELSFVVTFKFFFIKKELFELGLMELKVKIGKSDGLSKLPERIWDAFVEWIKEKFSDIFSTSSESYDSLSLKCNPLPRVISSLDEFHKHFKEFTRVIDAITVLALNINAINAMDVEQQKTKKNEKKKLENLMEKYQKWIEDQKEFIDAACILKEPPNVTLLPPQRLQATWSPPLKGGSKQYSYDIIVKTVDSSGLTREIVKKSVSKNSFECDDTRLAEATLIHVAVRSTLSIPISLLYEDRTASSDENYSHQGEWSEVTVFKTTPKPDVVPERKLKRPEKVTIAYDKCSNTITGEIFLTSVSDVSVIIVELLNGESVISNQPTTFSEPKTEGQDKIIRFGFNAEMLPSDASGPFTVQAQVLAHDNSGVAYVKSGLTRSRNHITRAKKPEWITLQYETTEDVVLAAIKSFDYPNHCLVHFMEGCSIKEESKVLNIQVSSYKDSEGNWHFSADGAYFRKYLNPGSDKLTCLAHVESTVDRLGSCPVLSWPKESPVFLLPPPSGFKCEYFVSNSITSRGRLQLKWDTIKSILSFQVGLTEDLTSKLIHSECAHNCQCIIIDIDTLTRTPLCPFECFVRSFGDTKCISSKRVVSNTIFYPLTKPSIKCARFDYSTSTVYVNFKGDRRASQFLLQCTFKYHPRISVTKMKRIIIRQSCNCHEELHKCSICFKDTVPLGYFSFHLSVQAVGGGCYISSQCQTLVGEPIPSPEWITVQPHYQADWTVSTLDVIWPKRFTLRQQYGLICSATKAIVWNTNSLDSRATINLSAAAVNQKKNSLQLQVYAKNVGNFDIASDFIKDTAVYYGCLVSETTGVLVFFTGVSLQRVVTLNNGNRLAQTCLAPKVKLQKLISCGKSLSSPLRILFDNQTDSGMTLDVHNIMSKYHKDLDLRLRSLPHNIACSSLKDLCAIQAEKANEWEQNLTERSNTTQKLEKSITFFGMVFNLVHSDVRYLRSRILQDPTGESGLHELQDEVEKVIKLAKSGEADLDYWKYLKNFLDELKSQMTLDSNRCQETYLKGCREEFLTRKHALQRTIVHLNELKTFSEDCNADYVIDECECALEKCNRGIEVCESRLKTMIEELTNMVEKEQERVVGEVIKCETQLRTWTTNIEKKHDNLQQLMQETTVELDSDGYIARATAAHAERAMESVIREGGVLGAIAIGGLGLAAIVAAGGVAPAAAAKASQRTKLEKIKQCQYELKKCDDIIKKCHVGIGQMRETIAEFELT